jgi:diguanylate cyclase (GGDEF)-like protein
LNKRKKIALLTASPEIGHGKRMLEGVAAQCLKYNYDLAVFCAMTGLNTAMEEYSAGEKNIFNLPNFDLLDGVILDTAQLIDSHGYEHLDIIYDMIKRKCHIPVVALDMPIHDIHFIESENEGVLREMARHVVNVHHKKRICLISGSEDNYASKFRMETFIDELEKLGIDVPEEYRVYSDFWYTGGSAFGQELADGKLPLPEAVLCGNDFLAMGLIYRLKKNGIKVPDDVIVIGYEATDEAAGFEISVSSFQSNDALSAANAVDYLRSVIEPDKEIIPYKTKTLFSPGMSCGCEPDYSRSAMAIHDHLYFTFPNYADEELYKHTDIGLLMESYISEEFTASQTIEDCIRNINLKTYLIFPFLNFYLCLKEDWMDVRNDIQVGYPEKMKIVAVNTTVHELYFHTEAESITFDTSLMIPRLIENDDDKPSVYYFSPVHFSSNTLGYAVIQRNLDDEHKPNVVYRNWLRFVDNALEMARAKQRLMTLSVRDEMTGAFNRRGMYIEVEKMLEEASDDASIFVCVIDMDRLKYINDTFGHTEGDFGIKTVSTAGFSVTEDDEIFVRAGGDEFYIIGIGDYRPNAGEKRIQDFNEALEKLTADIDKPYPVTASVGTALRKVVKQLNLEDIISEADEMMYQHKTAKKCQRI